MPGLPVDGKLMSKGTPLCSFLETTCVGVGAGEIKAFRTDSVMLSEAF